MKTNNKKLIVGALALVAGAGLVGSVSGSVAWFQYSTRVTAAYIGTAAHCSENMEIKINSGAWQKDYTTTQTQAAITAAAATLKHDGSKLTPLTTGAQAKDAALGTLYKNPVYQYAAMTSWGTAADANYLQFNVSLRVLDVDGAATAAYLNKEVYLTDLTIADVSAGLDLSDAVRVHIAQGTTKYALISKAGGETATSGKLDLNNDGVLDKTAGYEWDTTSDVVYGTADSKQVCYAPADVVANDTNVDLTGGIKLADTGTTADGVTLTVTIWLEGWQKLDNPEVGNAEASASESALWKAASYVGKQFRVGMRFAVDPHTDH